MQSFIQKHESASINPHAPGSPPLQNLNHTAAPVASPVIPVLDRQVSGDGANFAPQVSRPPGLGDNARVSLGPSRANELVGQQRHDGPEADHAWEVLKEEPRAADGLRERWEEQSNINSLFSGSEPARPASVQYSAHKREYDNDDTRSDIVDNHAPQPSAYFQPPKELYQAPPRTTNSQNENGRNPALDWDSDDSDLHSQGDEFPDQEQEHTPKAVRKHAILDDATMILNPPKPVVAPKPQKTVRLQDDALLGSPIRQALLGPMFSPPKKRVHDSDYDEEALRKMNFAELRNEPFDHDPARQVITSPAKPPADNLDDRLEFCRSKDEGAQAQLFTQMSVREWDESGDWFLERFSSVVTRMKEARQAKRKIVEQYEKEVSEREEEVRRSKEAIDRKLSKLKHDGSAMLKGSEPSD
ncbi:hypothetical protein KVR01_002677 [Diaporthe batatas]|uniref:uncharacterized protein n=1 Tax=Diaporthe batatas TaxID=748121 RepID=UPI001D0394E7|nr:uncharacterized protein KVR01_002677 [Diaporthe batatas]KAG8166988.1 hypothetical protein KVR01_002677 [Diaporthe batatas]